MNKYDQISCVGLKKLNVLDKLKIILGDSFQITGSISLIEYGIVKRKVGDIDIVLPSFDQIKAAFDKLGHEYTEGECYSCDGEETDNVSRIGFSIDGVKVCAFLSADQEYKLCEYMCGRTFKVSHPRYSIEAKRKYVYDLLKNSVLNELQFARLKKHNRDIELYYEKYIKEEVSLPM